MKLHKNSFTASGLIVTIGAVFLLTPVALAATSATPTSTSPSAPSASTTDKTAKPAAKIADRVAAYKTKQVVKLQAAEETRLKGSCKAAQLKVKTLSTKSATANTERTKQYEQTATKLSKIITRISDADVDTTDLEAVKKELATKVAQYDSDYTVYKTDLADISELDCVTDPTAFKAALLSARADQLTVQASAKAIRDYVPTIKEKLAAARDALKQAKASDTDTTTTNPTSEGAQ